MKSPTQEELDFEWLAKDQRGRRILWQMFVDLGFFVPTTTPEKLAFGEGGRSYAAWKFGLMLRRHGAELSSLLTENRPESASDDRDTDDADRDGYDQRDE